MDPKQPLIASGKNLTTIDPKVLFMSGLLVILVALALIAVVYDLSSFTQGHVWSELWEGARTAPSPLQLVFYEIRLPRVFMAILVGASLAFAGCLTQAVFKNPLASPSLIGVSSGASLFAALMIVGNQSLKANLPLFANFFNVPIAAFIGGLLICLMIYQIGQTQGKTNIALLLMAGVAWNAISGALTGMLIYLANDEELRNLTFWTLGSLSGSDWSGVIFLGLLVLIAGISIPWLYPALNALSVGDDLARHVGVPEESLKKFVLAFIALVVGVSVAYCGLIGFIGLVVPHIVRMLFGSDHKYLLPASLILGPIVLIAADFGSRYLAAPAEVPIGILTSALGGPFFLYLIFKMRKRGVGL